MHAPLVCAARRMVLSQRRPAKCGLSVLDNITSILSYDPNTDDDGIPSVGIDEISRILPNITIQVNFSFYNRKAA
jgi:hypothetical protein